MNTAAGVLNTRVTGAFERWADRVRPYRPLLMGAAAALFLGGLAWSFHALGIRPWHLAPGPLLALLLLFGPLGVAYGAVGLMLLARAGKVQLGLAAALRADAYAQLAEGLPLPGGAIVRAGALINAGAMAGTSAALVVASALLWIALASAATGFVLASAAPATALLLVGGGLIGAITMFGWLGARAGGRLAGLTLAHRAAGLAINAARLQAAFAAVHVALPIESALPFALASIAGSAASLAPAGLGISETLAALMARSLAVAAPAAFVAVAVNRLLALAATGLAVLAMEAVKAMKGVGSRVG